MIPRGGVNFLTTDRTLLVKLSNGDAVEIPPGNVRISGTTGFPIDIQDVEGVWYPWHAVFAYTLKPKDNEHD